MTAGNWIQLLSMALAIVIFLIPIIYFAGKLVGKFETIITRLGALEHKVDEFSKGCFTITQATERMKEVDSERKAMWFKLDHVTRMVRFSLFKQGINPDDVPEDKKK